MRKHAGGWICSDPDCKRLHNGFATSSLVRSNFKFIEHNKPICNSCWNTFRYSYGGKQWGMSRETVAQKEG